MQNMHQDAYIAALQWQIEQGIDEVMAEETVDRLALPVAGLVDGGQLTVDGGGQVAGGRASIPTQQKLSTVTRPPSPALAGTQELKRQAVELAAKATTLEELAAAIQGFDGLDIKKTATNFVFADGNPKAKIMLIGEAPGADEDRQGKPFVGVSGQLLDKILACIQIDRAAEDPKDSIYITNILNWRPPGNRSPTPQEMEIAKPFIEKHIALINPDMLLFCGGVAAQTLLHTKDSISKLRGKVHDFTPQTMETSKPISAIATYHPAYLLRTPSQKAKVWQDMLFLKKNM